MEPAPTIESSMMDPGTVVVAGPSSLMHGVLNTVSQPRESNRLPGDLV